MNIIFVSRHIGAVAWARSRRLPIDRWVEHLDISQVREGDVVIGTLPASIVAEVCALRARYLHLNLPQRQDQRGSELDSSELDEMGATLTPLLVLPDQRQLPGALADCLGVTSCAVRALRAPSR